MFLEGLDALDQKIVRMLIENARISYSDIGQKVGISRVAVKARIQALEQRGIIEEYTENQRCCLLLFRDRDAAGCAGRGDGDIKAERNNYAGLPCYWQGQAPCSRRCRFQRGNGKTDP